jgi:hypothetical protein
MSNFKARCCRDQVGPVAPRKVLYKAVKEGIRLHKIKLNHMFDIPIGECAEILFRNHGGIRDKYHYTRPMAKQRGAQYQT